MSKGNFWGTPFGGFFDCNGDGQEDFGELWLAEQLFEDLSDWRSEVEDGSAYGLFPEDYATREAYEDALADAKRGQKTRHTRNGPPAE